MKPKKSSLPPAETQFIPLSDDEDGLYDAIAILDERITRNGRGEYLVQWKGEDPTTREPWKPTWEPKSSCTDVLIQEWKAEKKKNPDLMGWSTREEAEKKKQEMEERKKKTEERRKKKLELSAARKGSNPPDENGNKRKRESSAATAKSDKRPRGSSEHTANNTSPGTAMRISPDTIKFPAAKSNMRVTANSRCHSLEPDDLPSPSETTAPAPLAAPSGTLTSETTPRLVAAQDGGKAGSSTPVAPPARSNPNTTLAAERIGSPLVPHAPSKQADPHTVATDAIPLIAKHSTSTAAPSNPTATIALSSHPSKITTPPRPKPSVAGNSLGPIPRPSPSVLREMPRSEGGKAFNATLSDQSVSISQADPIAQFSSPAAQSAKPKRLERNSVDGSEGEESAESVPVKLVEKVIGGEVWLMDPQSQNSSSRSDHGQPKDAAIADRLATKQGADDDADLEDFDSPKTQVHTAPALLSIQGETSISSTPSATQDPSKDLQTVVNEKDAQIRLLGQRVAELQSNLSESKAARIASTNQCKSANDQVEFLLDRVTKLTDSITALEDKLQGATQSKKSTSDDLDFFRAQYQNASTMAVENARRAQALEEQVDTLRKQLDIGLKQKSLHYEAIQRKREEETAKLRKTSKFLLEQSRLTDDAVRAKAVAYESVKAENAALARDNEMWEKNYDSLQMRNEDLVEQLAVLRGKRMGVFEDDSDTDSNYEPGAETDADLAGGEGYSGNRYVSPSRSTLVKPQQQVQMVYEAKIQQDNISADGYSHSDIMPGESQLDMGRPGDSIVAAVQPTRATRAAVSDEVEVEGGLGFVCKWNDGHGQCPMMYDSQQGLKEHARDHVHVQGALGSEVTVDQ